MSSLLKLEYPDQHNQRDSKTLDSSSKAEWILGRQDRERTFIPDLNLTWAARLGVSGRHAQLFYEYGAWYIEHITPKSETRVNGTLLTLGVPVELPSKADIELGVFTIQATYEDNETQPEGYITAFPSRTVGQPDAALSETRRVELLAQIRASLAEPDVRVHDNLLDVIHT